MNQDVLMFQNLLYIFCHQVNTHILSFPKFWTLEAELHAGYERENMDSDLSSAPFSSLERKRTASWQRP